MTRFFVFFNTTRTQGQQSARLERQLISGKTRRHFSPHTRKVSLPTHPPLSSSQKIRLPFPPSSPSSKGGPGPAAAGCEK